jgi:hypothetical protein
VSRKNRNRNKNGNRSTVASKSVPQVSVSVSTPTPQAIAVQGPPQISPLVPKPKRSLLILTIELLGGLAALATMAAGTGYAMEKWQETIPSIDFSGDTDQSKPFSIPLAVKNRSQIFRIHSPKVSCWIEAEYGDGEVQQLNVAIEKWTTGFFIETGQTQNVSCNIPDRVNSSGNVYDLSKPPYVVKAADLLVAIDYELWVPLTIKRRKTEKFVMLRISDKYQWIKGDWIGGGYSLDFPDMVGSPPWKNKPPF